MNERASKRLDRLALYRVLPFDVLKDFAPVSNLVDADAVLVVHPSVAAKSVKELFALAKAQPGRLNMYFRGDFERIGKLVQAAGIKPE